MDKEEKIRKFTEWLNEDVIANVVLEALEDMGVNASLRNMKNTWLNNLEHITADIEATIKWHTQRRVIM